MERCEPGESVNQNAWFIEKMVDIIPVDMIVVHVHFLWVKDHNTKISDYNTKLFCTFKKNEISFERKKIFLNYFHQKIASKNLNIR